MNELRVLRDPPAAGAWNMAMDEVLLETAATTGLATLRFYTWEAPTLSLGYFQSAGDRAAHCPSQACPMIRRASGGGAIVHDRELTYSIAIPERDVRSRRAAQLYDAVHRSLLAALESTGVVAHLHADRPSPSVELYPSDRVREPFLCFQRRSSGDVVFAGHKIAGSAQRRRKGAVLQHGSVLLAQSDAAPELPGIAEILGRRIHAEELLDRWETALTGTLALNRRAETISSEERRSAACHYENRFNSQEFTFRR